MTDSQRALLNGVLANPDDDAPRLIYADWLDEFGDQQHGAAEQADFIRLSIESHHLVCDDSDTGLSCPRCILLAKARALFNIGNVGWYHETIDDLRLLDSINYERGFLQSAISSRLIPHENGHRLLQYHPIKNWAISCYDPSVLSATWRWRRVNPLATLQRHTPERDELPPDLFACLDGYLPMGDNAFDFDFRLYSIHVDAIKELQRAVLAYYQTPKIFPPATERNKRRQRRS